MATPDIKPRLGVYDKMAGWGAGGVGLSLAGFTLESVANADPKVMGLTLATTVLSAILLFRGIVGPRR